MRNMNTHKLSYLRALDEVNRSLASAVSLRTSLVRAAVSEMSSARSRTQVEVTEAYDLAAEVSFSESDLAFFRSPLAGGR